MITASGIGSGLDIEGLVSQLVAAERQAPELRLNREEISVQASLSGFGQLKSALSDFSSSVASLETRNLYQSLRATSSDSNSVSVSAASSAAEGSYDIEVSALAERHSLASESFADSDTTEVGTGTLTIRFGTTDYNPGTDSYNSFTQNTERAALNLTIDSSNNTLQGISDAINAAQAGVRAAVVNDGSGYRLLLSSDYTGAENSLEISVADGDGNDADSAGLSRLAFNSAATNSEQTVAGADAQFSINGLSISSAENKVTNALEGVTLDLEATTDSPVTVDVSRNLSAVESAVQRFVGAYNDLQTTLTGIAGYDASTGQGGVLQGDFTASAVDNRIKGILRGTPLGVDGDLQRLSQIGVSTQSDGSLELDSAVLSAALEDNLDGVAALFTALGQPSSESVSFLGSEDATSVGSFAVNVTQAASRGQMSGTSVLPDFVGANDVLIDDDNDSFTITVDGVDLGEVTLTQGTYDTGDLLAAEIQSQINGAAIDQASSVRVLVSYSSGTDSLTITSESYGSQSQLEITVADADVAAELGLAVGTGVAGVDVAGTINGEAATGNGLVLTAAADTTAEGLQLGIGAGVSGDLGSVSFGRGLFSQLDDLLDDFLATDGLLDTRTAGLQGRVDDINDRRASLNLRMESIEARYRAQFGALDTLLAQLQSTSEFLTQQLEALPGPARTSDT